MKKATKLFTISTLSLSIIFSTTITPMADTLNNTNYVSEVFPEKTVSQIISKVNKEPIYYDFKKTSTNAPLSESNLKKSSSINGAYPTRKGVILVTSDAYKNLIPTGHAAIIYDSKTVVESLSKGVTTGKNNWNTKKKTCYAVSTYNTTGSQDKKVANWCYNQIGKPYNWVYLDISPR